MTESLIGSIQRALQDEKLDGWLFYSFRGSDPIACNILKLDQAALATRRWFYFVPAVGTPQKIVHAIEPAVLDTLPGERRIYLPWQQLHDHLREALSHADNIAMQYSPLNAIPYVSRVDAGTVELVRSCGVEVSSSADLVQIFEAVWSEDQLATHLYAARHMREIVDVVFKEVGRRIRERVPTTELDIQDFLWREFERRDLTASHRPVVAINAHSADPHYQPDLERNLSMNEGDFLLIDMWTRRRTPHAVYDDITWTGFIGATVPDVHQNIFNVVRDGRDAAIRFAQEHYGPGHAIRMAGR
jgi:Xaa-Pro aminopeptidase